MNSEQMLRASVNMDAAAQDSLRAAGHISESIFSFVRAVSEFSEAVTRLEEALKAAKSVEKGDV